MHKAFTTAALAAATAGSSLAIWAGPASAKPNQLSYEIDNGMTWTLANGQRHIASAVVGSYADAGVVADIGLADAFNGIQFTGSGPLADNIWIGDGDQAYTPGTHQLSDGANFTYGFDNHDGTFYMTDGAYAGQTLSVAEIQQDFHGSEVYAWVGVVYSGSPVEGNVTSINGQNTHHRSMGVAPSGHNHILTAFVR